MILPHLFRVVHGDTIFSIWLRLGQPDIVKIVPQELLGRVSVQCPQQGLSVTIVHVRCWNDRGVMKFEAASPADLRVAEDWAKRHQNTQPEEFKWTPVTA